MKKRGSLAQQLASGVYNPVERLEEALYLISRLEEEVNAFITLLPEERLREEAREAQRRILEGKARPLEGVLVAVKDNISVRGLRATAGSKMLSCYKPPYNAHVVERLVDAGAIIVGKTNMDEFAMGSTGEYSAYGPTRNPWDMGRVPGGSSSGSAAALAYAAVDLALGSDTGGSIRLPAAFTATVGLKPTYGAVSRRGLIPYANSLEQIGPMARSVRDLALLYSVIAGRDPLDATSIDYQPPDPYTLEPRDPEAVRLCVPEEIIDASEAPVKAAFEGLLSRLEAQGATIEYFRAPWTSLVLPAYYTIAMAEAASNLARYDGSLYPCHDSRARTWEELNVEARTRLFGPEVKRRIAMGVLVLSEGYRDEYYVKAAKIRRLVRDRVLGIVRECIIGQPTSPVLPPRLGERLGDPLQLYALDISTVTANLAGVPALQLPVSVEPLPVGAQLMARPRGEVDLFELGLLVEEITGLAGVSAF